MATVVISKQNRQQLHRLAVDYQWREYARRLALREARRAEVHRILGFTDAPYQPKRHGHNPGSHARGGTPSDGAPATPAGSPSASPGASTGGLNTGARWRSG